MNVLYVTSDLSPGLGRSSQFWRLDLPMAAINLVPGSAARMVPIDSWSEGRCLYDNQWADVIVIQRSILQMAMVEGFKWAAYGKKVYVDFDDGYQFIPRSVVTARYWKDQTTQVARPDLSNTNWEYPPTILKPGQPSKPGMTYKDEMLGFDPLAELKKGSKLVSGVTSPSQVILDDYKQINDCRLWIKNWADTEIYYKARYLRGQDAPRKEITIGWAGGGSHLESLVESGCLTALGRVAERVKGVRVGILGQREIFNRLNTRNKLFIPWKDFKEYPEALATLDIGVAPLVGPYDLRRSWIKAVEFTAMGIPWLATDYGTGAWQPYGDFPDHLVKNGASRWEARLVEIISNFDVFWQTAQVGADFARTMDIRLHVEEILKSYETSAN